jgi:hypothetical protein
VHIINNLTRTAIISPLQVSYLSLWCDCVLTCRC